MCLHVCVELRSQKNFDLLCIFLTSQQKNTQKDTLRIENEHFMLRHV